MKAKTPTKPRLKTIPISAITISDRARKHYGTSDDKVGLENSIREDGLISPITVEDCGDGSYKLLAGERRLTALKATNAIIVDAKIFPPMDELQRLRVEFGENFYRKNWELEERLELTKRIHDMHIAIKGERLPGPNQSGGHTVNDTAELMGRERTTVSTDLMAARYLEIAPELAKEGSSKKIIKAGKKLIEQHEKKQHAETVSKRKVETPRDKQVKRLVDSYILVDRHDDLLRSGAAQAITELDDESVDFIEFDPPYGIGLEELRKRKENSEIFNIDIKVYNEIEPEKYPQWISHMLKHCYRVLKPNSWICLWFAPEPWTAFKTVKVYDSSREIDYEPKQEVIFRNMVIQWLYEAGFDSIRAMPAQWYKYTGQTMQPDYYLSNDYEMFYYAGKGKPKLYRSWNATFPYKKVPPTSKWHPTQRPVALMYNIINVFCKPGSLILSPCLGSGSVILGADDQDCRCFGWELESSFRDGFVSYVDKNWPGEGKKWSNI